MRLLRTDVSEERVASIISVTRINLMMEAIHSSETSVLTRVTLRNIQEDGVLYMNDVCTSQEACYISFTKYNRSILLEGNLPNT
jgi:hypothetical protein